MLGKRNEETRGELFGSVGSIVYDIVYDTVFIKDYEGGVDILWGFKKVEGIRGFGNRKKVLEWEFFF